MVDASLGWLTWLKRGYGFKKSFKTKHYFRRADVSGSRATCRGPLSCESSMPYVFSDKETDGKG